MKEWIRRNSPPGMSLQSEKNVFVFGMCLATLYSLGFVLSYIKAYEDLFLKSRYQWVLRENALMPYYVELVQPVLSGFLVLAICMLLFSIYRYSFFYQGSKSIYMMRRLPQRSELFKMCLCVPCAAAAVCVLAAMVLFFVYFGIYMIFTPVACMQSGQWAQIWRNVL